MCHRSPGAQSASQLFPQRNQSWPTPHGEGSFGLCFNDILTRFAFTRYFARSKNNRHRFMKCLTIKHKGWFHHCLMNLKVFSMNLDRHTWARQSLRNVYHNLNEIYCDFCDQHSKEDNRLAPFPNQGFWTRPTQCKRRLHGNLDNFLYFWQIVHKSNINNLQEKRRHHDKHL